MFVLNPCRMDARVLREAATLAAAGHDVAVIARTDEAYAAAGEREARDGFEIVRVPVASGAIRWLLLARVPTRFRLELRGWVRAALRRPPAGWLALAGAVLVSPIVLAFAAALAVIAGVTMAVPPFRRAWDGVAWKLQWRVSILSWARRAAAAAPPADFFHAHDLLALPAATTARGRSGGVVVYDSHEVFVEAGANARRPAAAKRGLRAIERELASQAAALVTVNESIAELLGGALGLDRVVVVRNCPPRWDPPAPPERRFHARLGLAPGTRVVLYHGGFVRDRGIEALLAAVPWLPPDAVVVLLGYGPLRDTLVEAADAPGLAGRVHLLDAVPPDELLGWVASADVAVMANQPATLNERLSTPNKLFESLAAGTPVVSSDFPERRRIVIDDPDGPLGAVCDPTDPAALGAAIAGLLRLDEAAAADLRARCLRAAHARYAWETEAGKLLALYRDLGAGPDAGPGSTDEAATARVSVPDS